MVWAYDNQDLRELLHKNLIKLDEWDMVNTFLDWMNEDCILTFQNEQTKDNFDVLGAKRGNKTYAKNKRKKAREINQGLSKMQFDFPAVNSRDVYRDSNLMLVTLTFDRSKVSKEEAWQLLTSKGKAYNRFSANLSKIFGTKATWKVKEGTKSGYPAPHILVMVDRPVRSFRHKGKWRIQSNRTIERLRRTWTYGFIDVQVIVGGKVGKRCVVSYLTKYMTKTLDISKIAGKRITLDDLKEQRTAVLTHVWNKVFKSRDILSKAFKLRLNRIYSTVSKREKESSPWTIQEIIWMQQIINLNVKSFDNQNAFG